MKILMISGSLRKGSYNSAIINYIDNYFKNHKEIKTKIYKNLASIPPFNPDLNIHNLESDNSPKAVQEFRSNLKECDVLLISTPEYAFEISGVLKNALDWIVSSGELVDKKVLVVSASTSNMGGESAYLVLVKLLKVLSAKVIEENPLNIGCVNKKIDINGDIIDENLSKVLIKKILKIYNGGNKWEKDLKN